MTEKRAVANCGACFGTCIGVLEEGFDRDIEAFARFFQLQKEGKDPQLCRKNCGTYFVCHFQPRLRPGED